MKRLVLVTHDYGQGGAGLYVRCRDPEVLLKALGDDWELQEGDVAQLPFFKRYKETGQSIYDFDNPDGLLATMIQNAVWRSEGKIAYPIEIVAANRTTRRQVFARSKEEVIEMFPSCRFIYGVPLDGPLGTSDIDVEDEFIEKYGNRS